MLTSHTHGWHLAVVTTVLKDDAGKCTTSLGLGEDDARPRPNEDVSLFDHIVELACIVGSCWLCHHIG